MIGKTISHYEILEKLGEGGMGVVYKAEDTKLKRTVALKFLTPQALGSKEEKTRFVHEAQAAAALSHPNICTVYEIDEAEGPATAGRQTFIAMECIEGQSLKEKIESGPLKLEEALDIAVQVAEGLQEAHEKGIVHRDIKSANVMVTEKGQAKIMDFGLAKLAGRTKLTKTGMTMGTVAYMSPEQTRGEEVDERTDIWSLGVVLYEMVTGQLPFRGEYEQAVMYSIMNEEPEPMTGLRTGVPMELERIVNKAIAKNPGERYQHVDEMLVDLRSITKDLESRLVGIKERPTKARLPKKKRIFLYGLVTTLIILFIVVGSYFFTGRSEAINSIAVLPLENISGDSGQEYFVDGMTDALIGELAQISALRVISRTSVMQYKGVHKPLPEIARELNVDAVVEGTVLLVGERVRITAQLIYAPADRHLWAKNYEHDLTNILVLQSEVARAIAREIKVKLTPHEQARLASARSVNPEAYHFYLKGRYFWNKRTREGMKKGMEYFQQAIDNDPTYALAYAGLAGCYGLLGFYGFLPLKDALPKCMVTAKKALEINDNLAEAHSVLASYSLVYDWDWSAAENRYKRAIELNPNYANAHKMYAVNLMCMARFDEAMAEIKRAQELDPLSLIINTDMGLLFYCERKYDQAIAQLRKTLEMDSNFGVAHFQLGRAYAMKGRYEEAIAALQKAIQLTGGYPAAVGCLGYAYAVSGKRDKAEKVLHELEERTKERYIPPLAIANIYVAFGEIDKAFEWIEKAYEERDPLMVFFKVEPMFDSLRSDPRYTVLLRKMGLE